jgi:hypothetical protein
MRSECVDGFAKAFFIFQERRDVVKVDARLGEIGDFPNQLLQVIHVTGMAERGGAAHPRL